LRPVIKDGESFIYSAPTSAGKSLVGEVIMLQNALKFPEKVVVVIYPFISLITEKEKKYKPLFDKFKLNSISVHSGKFSKYEPGETNIMLCTIEKANSFLNKMTCEEGVEETSKRIS
jgi:DNA polymerase theta